MRFLANENFPAAAVASLADGTRLFAQPFAGMAGTGHGWKCGWGSRGPGDKVWRMATVTPCGSCRADAKPEEAGLRLAALITAREDWAGNFSVIEPGRVRIDRTGSLRPG